MFRLLPMFIAGLLCTSSLAHAEGKRATGTIDLTLKGFANDRGFAIVAVFDRAEAFPSDGKRAVRRFKVRVKERRTRVYIGDLPYGTYAISVLHDENANGKLDTNFLGIPLERLGASNDAPFQFGPPSWQDARFALDRKKVLTSITLRSIL
jgi:uncharacterized protein (DUF2141 family)